MAEGRPEHVVAITADEFPADAIAIAATLGFIAVVCSTTNVVGGFVITDRMLRMFKRKK